MYESYAPMALRWMKGIASEQQLGVFVHTGAGSVPVGSVSVLVAGPSIGSVETAVEALKSFVPIWKQDLVTIEKETIES
jgi:molybdopterin synthase catalytic subunit